MDESGKATLKSAINLVKPLYFQYVDSLLTEAGMSLRDELRIPDTYTKVILFYYFNKMNPGMEERPAFQKLWSYSKQRNNTELLFAAQPMLSPTFKRRLLMDSLGNVEDPMYLAKEDIKKQ